MYGLIWSVSPSMTCLDVLWTRSVHIFVSIRTQTMKSMVQNDFAIHPRSFSEITRTNQDVGVPPRNQTCPQETYTFLNGPSQEKIIGTIGRASSPSDTRDRQGDNTELSPQQYASFPCRRTIKCPVTCWDGSPMYTRWGGGLVDVSLNFTSLHLMQESNISQNFISTLLWRHVLNFIKWNSNPGFSLLQRINRKLGGEDKTRFSLLQSRFILLWTTDKVRPKENTYKWVSVQWKTKI